VDGGDSRIRSTNRVRSVGRQAGRRSRNRWMRVRVRVGERPRAVAVDGNVEPGTWGASGQEATGAGAGEGNKQGEAERVRRHHAFVEEGNQDWDWWKECRHEARQGYWNSTRRGIYEKGGYCARLDERSGRGSMARRGIADRRGG
jgi:hypothetical protein